jgi:hypothetical protein
MPTITRFLGYLLALATVAIAAVLALAYLVSPQTRTYVVPIDPSVLAGARSLAPPAPPPVVADPMATGTVGGAAEAPVR